MRLSKRAVSRDSRRERTSQYDAADGLGEPSSPATPSRSPSFLGRSSFLKRSASLTRSGSSLLSGVRRVSKQELNVGAMSDDEVRAKVIELFGDAERLRASLRDLQVRRDGMSNPGMFEVDTHNIFLNGSAFQETLQALQTCQLQQKALLADSARVSALCPTEYPELLRLIVELMTAFSRLAAPPGSEAPPENITDEHDTMRQRSMSASI